MAVVPFPLPGGRLDAVQVGSPDLVALASSRARSAIWPACGHRSPRVDGRYTRSPAGLPVSDRAVGLRHGGAASGGSSARTRRNPRPTFAEPGARPLGEPWSSGQAEGHRG